MSTLSANVLWHAAIETARISWPTVREARRGAVSHAVCDERLRSWAHRLLEHVDAELEVTGLDALRGREGPFVIVSNHESLYDIPCLYSGLPLSIRMAAKKELFRTPLWGQALRASGFVEIDRKNPESAYRALRDAGKFMKDTGISLYVAPEGTRSKDGTVGRFKKGAFEVSLVTGLDVLPVALRGTRDILEKGGRNVSRGRRIRIDVLAPVSPSTFRESGEMAQEVRERIASALARLDASSATQG